MEYQKDNRVRKIMKESGVVKRGQAQRRSLQVHVVLRLAIGDTCTVFARVTQSIENNKIYIVKFDESPN